MVESILHIASKSRKPEVAMAKEREEELLGLIVRFNTARRKGAMDHATSIASELFPALCDKLKAFTGNLFRNLNDTDHEDIVQDVMMALIRDNYAKLAKTRSLSYLYSICYSRGRDFGRRRSREYELDSIGDGEYQAEIPAPEGGNPDEVQAISEREAVVKRICDQVVPQAVHALPANYRDIASLVFIDFAYQDGKVSNEALFETIYHRPPTDGDASEMDNLRQRKSRARRKLLDILKEKTMGDPEAKALIEEFELSCHK